MVIKTLHDVTVDSSGKFVYTLELGNNHRVQKFTADGEFISRWAYEDSGGKESCKDPYQIAIDSLGDVYLPDKDGSTVLKFGSNGNFISKWGSNGTRDGQFNTPHGVAIDPQNNVFVTDMDNSRVQEFNSDGVFLLKWGSQGSGNGQFTKVTPGIDVDSSGYVYVIDKDGANVPKFDNNGKFITKWGSEGDDDGRFTKPEDIAVDSKTGNVYITDTGNYVSKYLVSITNFEPDLSHTSILYYKSKYTNLECNYFNDLE